MMSKKKKQFWTRVLVWVLTALMVLGGGTAILVGILAGTPTASAAEPEAADYVTAGLLYGSDVPVGVNVSTTVGFTAYAAVAGENERGLSEIFSLPIQNLCVVCDENLSRSAYTYSVFDGSRGCVVGGWHLEVDQALETPEEAEELLAFVQAALDEAENDMHPFIAYIDGTYRVRIGDYTSEAREEQKLAEIPDLAAQVEIVIVPPSPTALCVVDPETDVIWLEFDMGGTQSLGLRAMPDEEGNTQYINLSGRLYDGAFLFSRYTTSAVEGVQLVNMLPLDDYICGVVPYEISPNWDYEALRAFAIVVRNYTVKNRNRHAAYGFDICNTTHCQVYRGVGSVNDNVRSAVAATAGKVLVYHGEEGDELADIYYSSSTGGYTAGGKDTWGNEVPYLHALATPWERYSEHGKGVWYSVVSGKDLLDTLVSKGYTFSGTRVTDAIINAYSGDGPYVYSITYTDDKGKEVTIERCDKVRTSISSYLNSANFIVGKGSVEFFYDEILSIDMNGTFSQTLGELFEAEEEPTVLTAQGCKTLSDKKPTVQTASGIERTADAPLTVAAGASGVYLSLTDYPGILARRVTETVTADDPEDFIFAGKGWGHGVGLSQFGLLDLAEAGATAEQMLSLYFPTLEIMDYTEIR